VTGPVGTVEDGLLPANPVHRHHRRGKRAFRIPQEMLWATPEEVLPGAHQAKQLRDRASAILIITTAWTGCRWSEMAALQRHNTHLDDRVIIIDPTIGALKCQRSRNSPFDLDRAHVIHQLGRSALR
jgi:integrase